MNNQNSEPIETRPLPGVSIKTLFAIISATVVIEGTLLSTKLSLESKFEKVELLQEKNEEIQDLRHEMTQSQIKEFNSRLDKMSKNQSP